VILFRRERAEKRKNDNPVKSSQNEPKRKKGGKK
jgi:hypothetical protein